jgi:hypothetical protein
MGEKDQPPTGSTADTGGEKKANESDKRNLHRARRNRNRNRTNKREGASVPTHIPKEKFTGRSDDLKGFIYDITNAKGGVAYTRTTEEDARYVGEKYTTIGSYIRTAILTLTVPAPKKPTAPAGIGTPLVIDPVDQEIFREEIQIFVKTKAAIESTMKSLYDLIWGQCSESLRSRLRGCNDYATYSSGASDSLALLKGIRAKMTGFRNKQYLPPLLHQKMRNFYNLAEGKQQSNQEYYDEFNSMVVNTAEESGATIGAHPGGVTEILTATARDINNPTEDEHAASVHATT